jgi:hypothetical protein
MARRGPLAGGRENPTSIDGLREVRITQVLDPRSACAVAAIVAAPLRDENRFIGNF